MPDALPMLTVADAAAWRGWLGDHAAQSDGVWLTLAKKGHSAPTSLTYDQALEEALCHGWIDSQARGGDEASYVQRFTPRRARSPWSARNVGLVDRLVAAGRMTPAGLAEVERAKADGLTSQNRYAILYRVEQAKRPETRDRRIAQFVAMLAEGRTPYPQRRTVAG
jgi:uncharacterized protein YdeI (YjbR/CyaY-like superfamily)